jgi:hypothetical protein
VKLLRATLALFLLAIASPAFATYAHVQDGQNNTASGVGSIAASSITVTAGDTLIVGVYIANSGKPIATVTGNGNTYTAACTVTGAAFSTSYYYVLAAAAGATVVTATAVGGLSGILVSEYSGLGAYAGCIGQTQAGTTNGTDTVTSTTISITSVPAMLWGMTANENNGVAPTAGTGFTTRGNPWLSPSGNLVLFEDRRVTSTGSNAATFGSSGVGQYDNWDTTGLVFTEGSGASCTHSFWSSTGVFAVPNGTSGSYWNEGTGSFTTPNCTTGSYLLSTGAVGSN